MPRVWYYILLTVVALTGLPILLTVTLYVTYHLVFTIYLLAVTILYVVLAILTATYEGIGKLIRVIRSGFVGRENGTRDIEQGLPRNPAEEAAEQRQETFGFDSVCVQVVKQQQQQVVRLGLQSFSIDWRISSPCAICLDDFKSSNWCKVVGKCKHVYHRDCIDKWLTIHKNCPICRGSVSTKITL